MNSDDDRRAEALVRTHADAANTQASCLDAEVVAGFVEARLPDDERDAAIRHLAACPACRRWVADTADACLDVAENATPARPVRIFGARWAAAAAVLVVAAGASFIARSGSDVPTAERLLAAAGTLRSHDPALFGDFAPIARTELTAGARLERGGFHLFAPVGTILTDRPAFSWSPVAAADRYELRVRAADGRVVLERKSMVTSFAYPADAAPLAPGAYVWRIVARGVAGETEGSRAFTVATEAQASHFRDGLAVLDANVPARLRPVVAAHWALRNGFVAEARRLLGSPPAPEGWTDVERETHAHILRTMGETPP